MPNVQAPPFLNVTGVLVRSLTRALRYERERRARDQSLRIEAERRAGKRNVERLENLVNDLRREVFRLEALQRRKCPGCPF